jgi:hypothetical protein
MSQFYDLASLVVIPSGYKASTIYAQKPLTTDGQLSFSRASTATRVNASGLIEAVASNVPRLDYLGSSCPRLNLEPQRTNVALWSEQFGNAIYVNQNTTVTANATTSPDGTANADKLVITGTGVTSIFQEILTTASNTYTISAFVKKAETQYANLGFVYSAGIYAGMQVDLNDGSIKRTFAVGYTNPTSSITSYGNGWYRLTFSCVITTNEAYPAILPSNALWTSGELRQNLTGNNTTGAFFYGLQAELGSYATSYIPTLGASVTRVADAASKTGISSLIGQTEGVLFVDVVINGQQNASCNILNSEKSVVDSFYIQRTSSGTINAGIFANSVLYNVNAGSVAIGQRTKIALAYKSGSMALYINGVLIGTRTESWTFSSSLDDIFLNDVTTYFAYQENVSFNQALLFKTRLTNAQLAELTTL